MPADQIHNKDHFTDSKTHTSKKVLPILNLLPPILFDRYFYNLNYVQYFLSSGLGVLWFIRLKKGVKINTRRRD